MYKADFELERNARQEIAGQKEQLSADLQLLQRRNQMLLDGLTDGAAASTTIASQEQYAPNHKTLFLQTENSSMYRDLFRSRPISISSSSASEAGIEDAQQFSTYTCPVCAITYANVDNLYRHVNECLEKLQ